MRISKDKIKNINLFTAFFLAFSGFYVFLLAAANFFPAIDSRSISIPIRIIIVFLFGLIFILNPKFKLKKILLFFLLFSVVYFSRILVEYLDEASFFHISEQEFFLYFISFFFLPVIFISQYRLNKVNYEKIFNAIIIASLSFSLLSIYFYKDIFGTVARISMINDGALGMLSPLILSYCAALGIGISVSYLITNKPSTFKKIIIFTNIVVCFVPFFLGASRGSILALAFPFIFYLFFANSVKNRFKLIFAVFAISILTVIFAEYLGDGIFSRLLGTQSRIETGTEGRVDIWLSSIIQFFDSPLIGNSLNNNKYNHYPHNMFLEVLITTGVVGFVPFFLFILFVFKKIILIVKYNPSYFWICTIFMQDFTAKMFSGGIYLTSWLAIGAGLLIGFKVEET